MRLPQFPALMVMLALLLAGCASQSPEKIPTTPALLNRWHVDGKIAIRYQNQSQSAYFKWDNRGEDYTIRLHGPLGQGGATLKRNRNGVHLLADGREQTASSAEELLTMNLGWSFPVSDMNWWVRGLTSPHATVDSIQMDPQNRIAELWQQGWHIEYRRYQQKEQLTLPYKLVASRQNLTITLLLKKWQL